MLRAVVLAGGASSRMGRPKAGLRLVGPAETFLSRILHTLLHAGLPDIVVVTGCAAEAVQTAAGRTRRPIRFEHNAGWSSGQLSSLLTGLRERPGDVLEGALVSLVDSPLVSVTAVRQVVHVWRETRAPIVRPARGAEHGHPVIFDRRLFAELRAADPGHGAKAVVRAHEAETVNVPIVDPGAFVDIDTEPEYRRVLSDLRDRAGDK